MAMWLKEVTLLFLTAAMMLVTGQEPVILDQTQRSVSLSSGSSRTLICGLNTTEHDRYRVHFYFYSSGSSFSDINRKNLSQKLFIRPSSTSKVEQGLENKGLFTEDAVLKYTLLNVTEANSGWYFCTVRGEIPYDESKSSNGTQILIATVKSKEHTTYPSLPIFTVKQATERPPDWRVDWWLWILLGVSAVVLIVLLLVCILLRRRCRRHREADPIYANTRPVANKQPSPRPGMPEETLKKTSSSQNLRNPNHTRRHDGGKRRYR
ncbi:uncharacterized protein LOC132972040 isoform X1 [Labrus mixtus]|uniref:uncharacterized protein LOC132972040 isoform X1 n=1 Tax=Labrus mixtus TaxID=508554 RepID=UPI0029C05397|nr:uncharacterized protein LOC132972040 isoform X1 [Labrus mixtus]